MKIKGVFLTAILTAVLCIRGNLLAACPSADLTGDCFVDIEDFAIMAGQWLADYDSDDLAAMALEWLTKGIPDVTWVSINDPGVSGHEGFTGKMSKYKTTNAQYCQFLNAALATGDITISGSIVYGANGSNSGADFVGQLYYYLAGAGYTYNGATNGGATRIHYSGSVFSVDPGFENYPVTYVSWYGATAFCNYYGYRLPTEWEWQAVADYNGSFTYGCGTSINNSIANYYGSTHPYGTTPVGAFGAYGYGMCDMAGNTWEWTSSLYNPAYSYRVIRGGSWSGNDNSCTISNRSSNYPDYVYYHYGFRVCRDSVNVPDVTDMSQAEAEAAIAAAGLVAGTLTKEYSDTVAVGNIISQNPPAGEEVLPGSTVNFVISKGVPIVWVSINDPGVSGHEGFAGQMSKYETTNAQYCEFLNAALASGDITIDANDVVGANGTNTSEDFVGHLYYDLAGAGDTYNGATDGGAARINYTGSSFTVDPGFENYPVTYISWYGATAFCNYYGYRLPTEWEWQAVADYNGSFTYGCGTTMNNSIANYHGSVHPNGTTAVGAFGAYGYGMCDMAGNAMEWTSTMNGDYRVLRGGIWYDFDYYCTVSTRYNYYPNLRFNYFGFRVCR